MLKAFRTLSRQHVKQHINFHGALTRVAFQSRFAFASRQFSGTGEKGEALPDDPLILKVRIKRELPLAQKGSGHLPYLDIAYQEWGNPQNPTVFIMPSMSHSAVVTSASPTNGNAVAHGTHGWWDKVVGHGVNFGIDLDRFHVICAAPIGSPHGSTSPLSLIPEEMGGDGEKLFRRDFPVICPADQAKAHAYLLDHLGIDDVYAVVGASMGGMQVLEFAALYPDRVKKIVSLCSTGHTSPTTVAVRSLQRRLVKLCCENALV